jgi:hypothetical protein
MNTITLNGRRAMGGSPDPSTPILINADAVVAVFPNNDGCGVYLTGGLTLQVSETLLAINALLDAPDEPPPG